MSGLFDASGEHLTSAMPAGLDTMPMTQFCWVRPNTLAQDRVYTCVGTTASANNYFQLSTNSSSYAFARQRDAGNLEVSSSPATMSTGAWQLLIARHVSATDIRVRYNGTEYTATGSRTPSGCDILRIASRPVENADCLARIAHAGWVNRDIIQAEWEALEGGGNPITIFGADLVAYAPMVDEATWLNDPQRDINWTNTTATWDSLNPTVDDPAATALTVSVSPLYYGQTLLANKTNINFNITSGHIGLANDSLAAGTNGTTDASGNFVLPEATTISGSVDDLVTLHLYWEEGSSPVVDRSLIVKTTLVEDV